MFLRTAVLLMLLTAIGYAQKNPTASDAWAEAGDRALLVYATITNPTMYDVYITSASFPSAARAELWVRDKKVTSLTVPAFESLELKRGEARVRLFGPFKEELKAGGHLKGTLETDGGVSIEITAIVKGSQPGVGVSR